MGAAAAGGALLDAFVLEPHWLEVTQHDVFVDGLPASLDGFSLAQVTDAHLTTLGSVEASIVSAVREHDVQLVALTGDLVDSVNRLKALSELLGELRAPGRNVVATLGNWEHWGRVPAQDLERAYRDGDATLLVNEAAQLTNGIDVFATDDSTAGHARFDSLTKKRDRPRLLLTHSPALLDRFPRDADPMTLSLAGHTHGGQLRLSAGLVPFVPHGSGRFVAGWYDTPAGRAYISRGTGTSVVPARFTCRPELPILTLRQG